MSRRITFSLPLILVLSLSVIPLFAGLTYALLYSFGIVGVLNHGFTIEHWIATFANNEVLYSFLYTIGLSLLSITLCVSAGMFIALYIGERIRKGIISYFIYLPMSFPSIVAAFFFFQFLSNAGFLSRLFYKVGWIHTIADFPSLVNDRYSIGIIVSQFFLTFPVFVLLYLYILSNENISRLNILAASLGAGKWQILWRITVPALLRKSFPTILLFLIFKLGSYEIPLLLGRSSPETISVITVRKMQRFNLMDIPQGYVVAFIYAFLVLLLLIVSLKPQKVTLDV